MMEFGLRLSFCHVLTGLGKYFVCASTTWLCVFQTSPAACKMLVTLEHAPTEEDRAAYAVNQSKSDAAQRKEAAKTVGFWERVDKVFNAIDKKGDGDGRISKQELRDHFGGTTLFSGWNQPSYFFLCNDVMLRVVFCFSRLNVRSHSPSRLLHGAHGRIRR